jgi:integrase/recombinase XerD
MTRGPPIETWPANDRALWRQGVEKGGLFESAGAGAAWSDGSRLKTASGYKAWLSWLAAREILDPNLKPADRVTRERVAAYVAELQADRAPYTVLSRVRELYDALRVIAPEDDWKWLSRLYCALTARVRPVRNKLSRLRPMDELVALGERLMDEAEGAPKSSERRQAVCYRDGLIIMLLAYRPVRLKNLAMMRIDQHLIKVSGRWQVIFADSETKSRRAFEGPLPKALEPRLERYLSRYRPLLMRGNSAGRLADAPPIHPKLDALWVSELGAQLEYSALAWRIVLRTRAEFGQAVNPHLFRDAAATSIAINNPKHIGDASLVLGHADHRTTEKHYNHARSLEASVRHAEMLARLRKTLNANPNR